jgi:hypothetical protein
MLQAAWFVSVPKHGKIIVLDSDSHAILMTGFSLIAKK